MGTAIIVIIIILVIVGVIALVAMGSYNGFVKQRNMIQESWRQIDVELNRRYELIPNLVETVRAYAAHERNTLEDITRLRSQAQSLAQSEGGQPSQQRAEVEGQLSGAIRNLIVSVEAYPDLKSNVNFLELQRQLTETEDRIAAGRRFYNANVRVYNTKVESVPSNIIAGLFKFQKATYFEVNEPAARQAPNVSFGEIAYRGDPQGGRQGQLPQQQSNAPVQYGQPSDDLPNPQQYQPQGQPYGQQYNQPPGQSYGQGGGYQPPQQGGYQPTQQSGGYQPPDQSGGYSQQPGGYQPPRQGGGYEQQSGGYQQPEQSGGYQQQSGGYQPPEQSGGNQPPQQSGQGGGYQPPDAYPTSGSGSQQ
jgi:LemA protein